MAMTMTTTAYHRTWQCVSSACIELLLFSLDNAGVFSLSRKMAIELKEKMREKDNNNKKVAMSHK